MSFPRFGFSCLAARAMLRKALAARKRENRIDIGLCTGESARVSKYWMIWGLGLGIGLWSCVAMADVVGPPPLFCAPWKVAVTSHEGSRCELKAPENCPSGWRGQIGGDCGVARCDGGMTCPKGTVCADQSACIHRGTLMTRHGPTSSLHEWPVGICGAGATCDAPDRCDTWKICVEPGTAAVAYVPKKGDPNDPGPPRKSGGCSIGGGGWENEGFWALGLLAIGIGGMVRRRRG